MIVLNHFTEAKSFLRRIIPTAVSTLGPSNKRVLCLRGQLGQALLMNAGSQYSLEEIVEAEKLLADVYARERRVYGASHPDTRFTQSVLEDARAALEVARRVETSK